MKTTKKTVKPVDRALGKELQGLNCTGQYCEPGRLTWHNQLERESSNGKAI